MNLGSEFYTENELKNFKFGKLGHSVKIKKNASLYFIENIHIGDYARIDDFSIIVASNEPVKIGRNVHIASQCYLAASAGLIMSDFSGLSPGVKIYTGSDDYTGKNMTNPTLPKEFTGGPHGGVTLGKHVIIGSSSVILPKVEIGEGSSVGALSLVRNSLAPWGVYAGNPIKKIRPRDRAILEKEKDFLKTNSSP
jgi:acetyltransferase-like isoleucine patch superfamily enzyme